MMRWALHPAQTRYWRRPIMHVAFSPYSRPAPQSSHGAGRGPGLAGARSARQSPQAGSAREPVQTCSGVERGAPQKWQAAIPGII